MNRCRPYCQMNPLTGIYASRGNALGYRYASPDGDGFPVTYSVTHSHTDHPSLITVHSSYTFSAKEKDTETGFSVTSLRSVSSSSLSQCQTSLAWHSLIRRFGSRYYSSDLSIWLSVDPMAGKYPSMSSYVYCANNPVKLVDPNGEEVWKPDEDGNLIAEKGDNAWTLAKYLNTSPEISKKMLEEQGYKINDKGILNLKEGDVFKVDYGNVTRRKDNLDVLGNNIRRNASIGIAQDLFTQFWNNEGNVELNGEQFAGILLYIKNNPNSVKDKENVLLRGNSGNLYNGQRKEVNFYNSSSYALAFGKASIYTNESGNIVGFYDVYDFNPQKWGNRSFSNEIKTRMVNTAATLHNACSSIQINYGYSKRD